MTRLLGVDGGGSKTRAIVCDDAGVLVGEGHAASSNPVSVGWDLACEALASAALAATAGAPVDGACFGVAGLDREEDRARVEAWARGRGFVSRPERVRVVHDSALVLAAGTPEGWGLGLICGTGSVAFGASRAGVEIRAGGWGWLFGDEGSGYAIGIAALREAMRAADGRGGGTALLDALLEEWRLANAVDLAVHAHRSETTRREIARLAELVLRLADAGDTTARAIVSEAARTAAELVTSVARRLDVRVEDAPLAMAGGLLAENAGYRAAIVESAGSRLDRVTVVSDPARGALTLARRLVSVV